MNIGLCAWSFTGSHREAELDTDPHTAAGLLATAKRLGLNGIEGASGWFENSTDEELAAFQTDLQGAPLFVDTGGHDYAEDVSPLTQAIDVAARVGAPVVRTTISRIVEGDRRSLGADGWRAHLEGLVEPLQRAAERADSKGIEIGIENHQDLCSHELVWLCEQVGGPRIGVTLDVGNTYAVGERTANFVQRIQPFLKHVHLKDYTVHPTESGYVLKRCALGDGIIDWPALLGFVDENCPNVAGCVELGATTGRHIRLFEPSWWETFPQRPFVPESVEALGDLQRAAQPREVDWRTPHETEAPASDRAAYELDQIDRSAAYLKSIDAI